MKAVWKYPLADTENRIELPIGAQVLTVQMQGNNPCLWVLVEPEQQVKEYRWFNVYGTGYEINIPAYKQTYQGTVQMLDGKLVFHIFENTKKYGSEE
jgi:hypothetical protein